MHAHDYFVPIGIDVALGQRHRLRQNVITGANEVHIEDFVVADETKDALVKVTHETGRK